MTATALPLSFANANRPPLLSNRSGSFTSTPPFKARSPAVHSNRHAGSGSSSNLPLQAEEAYDGVKGELDAISDEEGHFDYDTSLEDVSRVMLQRLAGESSPSAGSTAPLQPRRPALPHAASSSARSLKHDGAPRAAITLPPKEVVASDISPALPTPAAKSMAPETPKGESATADGLLSFVLSLRRNGQATPLSRTASETGMTSVAPSAMRRQDSHSRNESGGSATSVEEELERSKALDMSRSASASSLGVSKGRPVAKELTGLESVDLSHRRIAALPASVLQVLAGHIERLALGYNDLTGLPPELTQLGSSLRYLNVRVNYLTTFPTVLCELPSLEILDISRNKIVKLPKASGTLKNLKVLSLSKNRIAKLPRWFTEMTTLRVLKLDHNPIVYPPREVTAYPAEPSTALAAGDSVERKKTKSDDPVMAKWILKLRTWIADHPSERRAVRPFLVDGDNQSDTDTSVTTAKPSIASQRPALPSPVTSTPMQSADTPKASRTAAARGISPTISPSTSTTTASSTRSAATSSPTTPLSFLEVENGSKPAMHGRNASVSTPDGPQMSRPALRAKKSLPDMRQSHAQILDERIASESEARHLQLDMTAARRPRADSIASPGVAAFPLPSPRPALSASTTSYFDARKVDISPQTKRAEQDRPRRTTETDFVAAASKQGQGSRRLAENSDHDRSIGIDRNSGAYFRRLSMLPPSTISKQVPLALLQFVDAIRGILFALSQLHSALKQFVMFAMPDRLPGVLAKMMSNADGSMSSLIDALDRFDGSTRRATPTSGVVREVFEACRENVSVFGNLVGVLALQLKALTSTADVRYTRTLLLMLYGSMAEIAAGWTTITPLADELRSILHGAADQPVGAALLLQPPTPSPKNEEAALPAPGSFRPPPLGPPPANGRARSKSVGRRHAGSFSAEDVSSGAALPQHSPKSSLNGVTAPVPATLPLAPASMKARPGAPKLNMQIASMSPSTPALSSANGSAPVYSDLFKHLNDLPPTPVATAAPAAATADALRELSVLTSIPPVQASVARPSPTSTADAGVLDDFLDMIDKTTNVALSVCSMLTERTNVNRFTELNDLCDVGAETAKLLKEDLEKLPGGAIAMSDEKRGEGSSKWRPVSRALTASDCKRLWDGSNAFAKAVIQIASLARAVAQEAARSNAEQPFADAAREGISQMARATNQLISLGSVAVKPR